MTIAALVVTYGDRAELCREVVGALRTQGIDRVFLVDNASAPPSRLTLEELAAADPAVELITEAENRGSAGGFHRALEVAMRSDAEHLWLLDDDNRPRAGCVEALRAHIEDLRTTDPLRAIACFREVFPGHREAAQGLPLSASLPARSSFLSLSVTDFAKYLRRRRPAPGRPKGVLLTGLPFAAYGGLLVPRGLVEAAGLPDPQLFAYADDVEWTARFAGVGGSIALALDAAVEDLHSTYADHVAGNMLEQALEATDDRRYLLVRNLVSFEYSSWRQSPALYQLNKVLVGAYLSFLIIRRRRGLGVLRQLASAVADGEHLHQPGRPARRPG